MNCVCFKHTSRLFEKSLQPVGFDCRHNLCVTVDPLNYIYRSTNTENNISGPTIPAKYTLKP